MKLICATIGTQLIHAKAYSPESKAKIERSFRTVKDNFLNLEDWSKYNNLKDLNEAYRNYIVKEYNSKYHSGINDIPRNRFQRDYDKLKFVSVDSHTISSNDSQIKFSNKNRLFQIKLSNFQIIFPIIAK